MALLQTVYTFVIRHGILPKLVRFLPVFSFVLAIVGVSWLAVLPMDGQYRNTYISENALMPSQAYSYFRESEWNILRGYRTQIQNFTMGDISTNMETMRTWLEDVGYKTEIHKGEHGDNLYAIFHAPRGDDTEAIVLGAGYFNSDGEFNISGMSLALALARYFHRWIVWSKNIIIVIPTDPDHSLREWVNAYHTSLDLTGGSIEAAIMMDYPSASDNFEYIELYYEGVNGQLPNLDLLNVAISVSEHEGPRVSLQGTGKNELRVNNYWSRLRILSRGITELALAGLKTGHGNEAFSGWRVQALTLKAKETEGPFDVTVFGRIPEAVFRSVNNLLEKFHQSFFFYLLLAPRNFVSIGTYLPAAAMFAVAFILSSLDKVISSGYEVRHLSPYAVSSTLYFIATTAIGYLILTLMPIVPTVVNYSLIAVSAIISLSPLATSITLAPEIKPLLRGISLMFFSTVLSSLLVLNFSLTFTMGLFSLPLTFIKNKTPKPINCLLLLISNPFILSLLFALDFENGLFGLFQGLVSSWKELNCHTLLVVTCGWFPTWLSIALSVLIEGEHIGEKKTN
ncbi:CYFA0S02e05138g1_1 [Cyberlindnera fabianii]|uniref:CYFA0S02e05138g1_1 n=1 Tax=Cyberlindnera fabianii TaxID=36022 RepID=A0A061ATM1_CYBFA|nr:CYFA0S02e05138g1_1 [Cyberlindnera fabianii]